MALPTTATLTYTIKPVPPVTNVRLAAAVAAVVLPHNDLANFGATFVSDNTTQPTDASVQRTLVFNLTAGFFKNFNYDAASPPAASYFDAIFRNFYTHILGGSLGSIVDAADPVLA